MSGISGLWNLDGRPIDPRDVDAMSRALRHRGREAAHLDTAACLRLASHARGVSETAAERTSATDATGSVLVFDGRLDDRDDLIAVLESRSSSPCGASDAALALGAYRAFGDEFAARLNGDFALALFDRPRGQLVLTRDPIGVRPLYYCTRGDTLLFASEIKALLAVPGVEHRANDGVLASFLLTRFARVETHPETFFRDILSVLPAHSVFARRDGIRTLRYWDFDVARRVRFARQEDYLDAFRERFQTAVRRRLRSEAPVAVAVSGGLDSSAILCAGAAMRGSGPDTPRGVLGVSHVYEDGTPADEKKFLSYIETACALNITRLADLPTGIMDRCESAVWHAEAPFLGPQWNATHASMTAVKRLGVGVLLTGHWGDQFLFDDAYLLDLCGRGAWQEAWKHVNEFGRWVDVPVRSFRRRFFNALLREYAPSSIVSVGRRVRRGLRGAAVRKPWYTDRFRRQANQPGRAVEAARDGSAHARSLYAEARSQYNTFCMEWNNKVAAMHGLDVAFPFLDRDLIGFLMAIPGEVQSRRGVHKGILREALAGVLPPEITGRTEKADFTALVNDGFREEYNRLLQSLSAGARVAALGYVDCERLRDIRLPDAMEQSCEASWALSDVFSLELWLRQFGIHASGPSRSASTP